MCTYIYIYIYMYIYIYIYICVRTADCPQKRQSMPRGLTSHRVRAPSYLIYYTIYIYIYIYIYIHINYCY